MKKSTYAIMFSFSVVSFSLAMLLSYALLTAAMADEFCNTIPDCQKTAHWLRETFLKFSTDQVRLSRSDALFVRDFSQPKLGLAFKDPSGLIWGETLRDTKGNTLNLTAAEATDACKSIDARLPTSDEWEQLRRYLGGTDFPYEAATRNYSTNVYGQNVDVLPGLEESWLWSSSPSAETLDKNYAFYPGLAYGNFTKKTSKGSALCVVGLGIQDTHKISNTSLECNSALACGRYLSAVNRRIHELSQGDVRVSVSGAAFVRDNTFPGLAYAFRDPSGLIWGDLVMDHGKRLVTTQPEAAQYCDQMGGRLPSKENFKRFLGFVGITDKNEIEYNKNIYMADAETTILPNLGNNYRLWTSTVANGHAVSFYSGLGFLNQSIELTYNLPFRCVNNR